MKNNYEIRNAKGAVCCSGDTPDFPRCAKCQGKTPTQNRGLSRVAPVSAYAPPDSYAPELARLKTGSTRSAAPKPATYAPPDSYAADLAAAKGNR